MFKALWRLFKKNPKRNTAIIALLFGGAAFAGVEWTATPTFCGTTCHIMNSYHVSWKNSTHKNIACVDCHIPPGMTNYVHAKLNGLGQVVDDLLARTSTKPSASISDFACLRSGCHVTENLGKVEQTEERPFKFDHTKHLALEYKGIPFGCSTCHSHVQGEKHFEVNTNICVNCHLLQPVGAVVAPKVTAANAAPTPAEAGVQTASDKKVVTAPTACTACHDAPSKPFKYEGLTIDHNEYLRFGAQCTSCHKNATLQPRVIESGQCYQCHDFGKERFTTAEEMHHVHATGKHKVECFSCHGVIQHGPEAQKAVVNQFDCMKCHQGQHMVQRSAYTSHGGSPLDSAHGVLAGAGGEPAEDDAISPMFLVHVDCTGCHIKPSPLSSNPTSGATVNKAVPEACDACHQPGFGKQLVANWQKSTRSVFDAVEALMPSDAKPWAKGNAEAEALVKDARRIVELVRVDGSWGVHNPRYTEQLLESARTKIMKAKSLVSGNQAPTSGSKESGSP